MYLKTAILSHWHNVYSCFWPAEAELSPFNGLSGQQTENIYSLRLYRSLPTSTLGHVYLHGCSIHFCTTNGVWWMFNNSCFSGGRTCVSVCVYMCACVCIVYCKFYCFPITLSLEDNKTINWTLAGSAGFLGISILQLWLISSYQCECH